MNDFLQNLRNGQAEKQRTQKTRKSYDNSYHYTNTRYHAFSGGYQNSRPQQQMPRASMPSHPANQVQGDENLVTSMLAEAIENLSLHVETLARNQEYMAKAQEKTARMFERQINAIESVLSHFNIAFLEQIEDKEPLVKRRLESNCVNKKQPVVDKYPQETIEAKKEQTAPPVVRKRKKIVERTPQDTEADNGKILDRDEVMNIIQTMREEGATFDKVAARLTELGQPTFSGRGEWHAQTIHRLCNK